MTKTELVMVVAAVLGFGVFMYCLVSIADSSSYNKKPLTRQICAYGGFSSESIIAEQAEEGYIFTGTTKTFVCDNMLNFQLIEGVYSDKTEDEEGENND